MADLISRAAVLNDLSYCAPELWQDEEYIKAKITKQPAVDAIPVEWLKAHRTEYFEDWGDEPVTIDRALIMWQNEQEAR